LQTQGGAPHIITLDSYAVSHRAVREVQNTSRLPEGTKRRSSKYLNT
jgi:putative transposase